MEIQAFQFVNCTNSHRERVRVKKKFLSLLDNGKYAMTPMSSVDVVKYYIHKH